MSLPPTFSYVDGILVRNQFMKRHESLAVVRSVADVTDATDTLHRNGDRLFQLAPDTVESIEAIQDPIYLRNLQIPNDGDGSTIIDNLSTIFSKYDTPIGLISKLLELHQYRLNFIIDDSLSMSSPSSITGDKAFPFLKTMLQLQDHQKLTRWQEAQNRLHVLFDIISNIPCHDITLFFMNESSNTIVLHRGTKSPRDFCNEAHDRIYEMFAATRLQSGTPTFSALSRSFANAAEKADISTMHYLLTDGEPTDFSLSAVCDLVVNRHNPDRNPLTIITCSDDEEETAWLKQVSELKCWGFIYHCFIVGFVMLRSVLISLIRGQPTAQRSTIFTAKRKQLKNHKGLHFRITKGCG
jgi:hypothetical protein